ncbi:MAG: rhomboid family intramembrane serine protease, partial [Solirubrobacterales bacterium]|nr:rhomboid family intramembrane serine protease [Solirubrobacterales bacterium]
MIPIRDNIPTDRPPVLTLALIAANCAVYFLLQNGLLGLPQEGQGGTWNVPQYAAIPCELTGQGACRVASGGPIDALTVLTAMFMHGSILHLGGNMLFLWIFGNNIEDAMGRARYLIFYVLGGVAAFAAQALIDPSSAVPTIGASGAVAAVLGGYLLTYPRARVATVIVIIFFFTIFELPAVVVLGFWFVQQVAFGYFDLTAPGGEAGGVAYFAHIGGFVFGMALIRVFATRAKAV